MPDGVKAIVEKTDQDLLLYELKPADQEFVLRVLDGETLTKAYEETHPACTHSSALRAGSRAWARVDIKAAYDQVLELAIADSLRILRGAIKPAISTMARGARGGEVSDIQYRCAKEVLDRTGILAKMGLELSQKATDVDGMRDW